MQEYQKIAWNIDINNKLSWRGILSQQYNLANKNLSSGGASNQLQFRLAKQYFLSDEFQEIRKKFKRIIILWGITSTARNEIYSLSENKFLNFHYTSDNEFSRFFLKNSYNHEIEVSLLKTEMLHWNHYFKYLNLENYWFDTFNTHDYTDSSGLNLTKFQITDAKKHYENLAGPDWPSYEDYMSNNTQGINPDIIKEINNLNLSTNAQISIDIDPFITTVFEKSQIEQLIDGNKSPRDLLSWLMIKNNIKFDSRTYHLSMWKIDIDSLKTLIDLNILNPYSHHPTQTGHEMLVNFFQSRISF